MNADAREAQTPLPPSEASPHARRDVDLLTQRKLENFEALQASTSAPGPIAANRPLQLFLEVASSCNLRCAKCALSYDVSLNKGGMMAFSVFSDLSDFFDAAIEVQTFGFGEMFLYPRLESLVTLLKRHGCRVAGVTNGTLIREADARWLVAQRYDDLTFSIDAATQGTMKRLRGADLDRILRILEVIDSEKQVARSLLPRIIVNFVAQADNYRELPDLVRRLAPLHVYFLGVNPLHHFESDGLYSEYYAKHCLARVPRQDFESVMADASRLAEESEIGFVNYVNAGFEWRSRTSTPERSSTLSPPEATHPVGDLPPMYCLYPWTTLYLSANQTAKVCCYMSQHENLGSYKTVADAENVWNGPRLMAVRDAIRNGQVHPACRTCVSHRTFETHEAVMRGIRRRMSELAGSDS